MTLVRFAVSRFSLALITYGQVPLRVRRVEESK